MYDITFDKLFNVKNEHDFNHLALKVFNFQYANNTVYRSYVDSINIKPSQITHYKNIPFLPIEFFKSHEIVSAPASSNSIVFTSSSTTSQIPSQHIVTDVTVYEKSFLAAFKLFYGEPENYTILALLPGYLERKGSSLVYMFNELIRLSKNDKSGFYLNNYEELLKVINECKLSKTKVLLIGVTYALLDLAEREPDFGETVIVMETGGMKGRRKEMVKEELHSVLTSKLGVKQIHSEYGMTELLSQAYSKGEGLFECPPWMKTLIRDTDDPFSLVKENKTGGINIIDLANLNSCSFIATQDLGRINGNYFEVMGRFDNSDIRGCNLMIG